MTTTKKPVERSRQIQSVPAQAISMTNVESAWLAAYRAMDDKARDNMLRAMQRMAIKFPRAPRLRLVSVDRT